MTFTANICHGKQLSTQHCPALRLTAKTNFSELHNKQVAFNTPSIMMADTETVHFWRLTRQANHHPGQSDTKEVIDTKSMSKPGSVTTSKVDKMQVTTATIDLSYTRFPEDRIDSEFCYIKYLRRLILLWNYGPPHPVMTTLKSQRKAPEVQLSNAGCQL